MQQAMAVMFLLWLAMLPPAPLAVGLSFLLVVAKALVAVCSEWLVLEAQPVAI